MDSATNEEETGMAIVPGPVRENAWADMFRASKLATRGRYRLRNLLSNHPSLFLTIMRRRSAHREHVIESDTEIMIEGYPRSGNTFAVAAFELAQVRPVRIARHLHASAHVIVGAQRGLPVLVVIRNPIDAVTSLVIRHPGLHVSDCLAAYLSFHKHLLPFRADIVVAPFDRVITDFGSVISDVNLRFGTSFTLFQHTPESVAAVFDLVDEMDRVDVTRRSMKRAETVARPTREREVRKAQVRELLHRRQLAPLVGAARTIYQEFLDVGR